jgi:hypothetical protein
MPVERHIIDKPRTRLSKGAGNRAVAPGPDSLFPGVSCEDERLISLQRKIDIEPWSKGEPYSPALARKFRLTGPNRKFANNPTTKMIIAQKADLRRKIATSSKLVEDFEFFLDKMGWYPEMLLQQLYWDSNMMHADPQTVISKERARTWPIEREDLREMLTNIRVLTDQLERLSETDFSPARTIILQDEKGRRLSRADERYLLKAFSDLPGILRCYGRELHRKVSLSGLRWSRQIENSKSLVAHARKTSLYEQIRAKTGRYHAVRLHRLINLSRQVQGLPLIKPRAFFIWLNRLKKRHDTPVSSPSSSPIPQGSPLPPKE